MQRLRKEDMIVFLKNEGYTIRAIKGALRCSQRLIDNTIRFWNTHHELPPPTKRGRPKKVNETITQFIERKTLEDAAISDMHLAELAAEEFHVALSRCTINGIRHFLRFTFKPPRHVPALTDEQKYQRIRFASTMLSNHADALDKIVFSDESRFVLGADKTWVWRRRGEYSPSSCHCTMKFPQGVMVWGAIGLDYKSPLIVVDGSIDTEKYKSVLESSEMIPSLQEEKGLLGFVFQQDGATCHTSKNMKLWLAQRLRLLNFWPANSPDLNPIEHLWGVLKRTVAASNPKTLEELKNVLQEVWNAIDQGMINRLVTSFRHRLILVARNGGKSIGHLIRRDAYLEEEDAEPIPAGMDIIEDAMVGPLVYTEPLPEEHSFTQEDDEFIVQRWVDIGPQWKTIAKQLKVLPNEVKNRWLTHLKTRITLSNW